MYDSESYDEEITEMTTMDPTNVDHQDYMVDYDEDECFKEKDMPLSVDILYCAPKIIYVPKCCNDSMMINLNL